MSDDDSSCENEMTFGPPTPSKRKRGRLKGKRVVVSSDSSSDSSDTSDDSDDASLDSEMSSESKTSSRSHTCTGLDSISLERLDPKHFTFIPDNGESSCFNLSTLIKCGRLKEEKDGFWFKEPPIFRKRASNSTIQKMKNIFGKEHIEEYLQQNMSYLYGYELTPGFQDAYARYTRHLLPNKDLYVCPVCYEKKLELLENPRDHVSDPLLEVLICFVTESDDNERAISQGADSIHREEYTIQYQIWFLYKSELMNHLEKCHDLEDVRAHEHSDLYKRYMLRASDGLIQKYYRKHYPNSSSVNRYWGVEKVGIFLFLVKHGNPHPNDDCFVSREDSQKIWNILVPGGSDEEDDSEFIDDDVVDDNDAIPHLVLREDSSLEEDIARDIEERYGKDNMSQYEEESVGEEEDANGNLTPRKSRIKRRVANSDSDDS